MDRCRKILNGASVLALAVLSLSVTRAHAVPAFAVQTGRPCAACHVGGFGPQLTPFGRDFKLHGYTARAVNFNVPLSAMVVASYLDTAQDQVPPAKDFSPNDNWAVDQVSLFLAGGVGAHLGGFVQNTYDGVAHAFHWDNLDLRAITTASIGKNDLLLGLSLNNAPTVQDPWNTLSAWGFPYTTSALAPGVGAAPIIGGFAQNTLGFTAYALLDKEIYAEIGAYRSLGAGFLTHAGVDPSSPGQIGGEAPYARIAYQKNYGDQNFQVGAFVMAASLFPGRDHAAGKTDRYTDLGFDASYQRDMPQKSTLTVNMRYTHEAERLSASRILGAAQNGSDTLEDFRLDTSYYYEGKVGATVGFFNTWGSPDPLLYSANRALAPDSTGLSFQIDGTPFGDGESPLGPRFNVRVGIQCTIYTKFDGAADNYDGFGHNASDNNSVRVFTWLTY
jgi:hypothetical protein